MRNVMWSDRALLIAIAAAAIAGCGGGLKGVYEPVGGAGFFEKLEFRSENKVEITFFGSIKEATYEVDGDRVRITNAGETQIFTIDDDGCVDGGGLLGRYCRAGAKTASKDSGGGKWPEGTYVAESGLDKITLEFRSGGVVHATVVDAGSWPVSVDGSWKKKGKKIVVEFPDADGSIELSRRGDDALEGAFEGDSYVFSRR